MNSNSKLTPDQKFILKNMKMKAQNMGIKLLDNGKTTIAYKELGNTVKFSVSVTSPDEKKYRSKVGQFYALERIMNHNQYVTMNKDNFYYMLNLVFGIYI